MIKMSLLLTRRADLTFEQFSDYWMNTHWPIVRSLPEVVEHTRRYVQLHNTGFVPQGMTAAPYDGVAEAWFDNAEAALAVIGSDNWAANVTKDDLEFLDVSKTQVVFSTERVDYPGLG